MIGVKITRQPVSATVASGKTVSVSVEATGDGLSYQWWYAAAGSSVFSKSSATTRTYTTTMNSGRDGMRLFCVVTDAYGNTAGTNTVTINMIGVKITRQPVSATVASGKTVSVSVEATGEGLSYQWWYAGAGSNVFSKSSANMRTYTTTMNSARDGMKLYCVVTDTYGNSARTNTVTINMA